MVKLQLKENWNKLGDADYLIARIAHIVDGDLDSVGPFEKTSVGGERCWQLDAANDWFAKVANNELTISYRYGGEREDIFLPVLLAIVNLECP